MSRKFWWWQMHPFFRYKANLPMLITMYKYYIQKSLSMASLRLKAGISFRLFLVLILNFLLLSSILSVDAQTEIPELTVNDEFVDNNSYLTRLAEDFLLWNKTYIPPAAEIVTETETVTGLGTITNINVTCNGLIYINQHGLLNKIMVTFTSTNYTIFVGLEFLYNNSSITPSNMTLDVITDIDITISGASVSVSKTENFTMWYLETTERTVNDETTTVWKYQLGQEVVNPLLSLFPDAESFEAHFTIYYAPSLATIVELEETSHNIATCGEPNFLNYSITEVRLQTLGATISSRGSLSVSYIFLATFFLFYFLRRAVLKRRKKHH